MLFADLDYLNSVLKCGVKQSFSLLKDVSLFDKQLELLISTLSGSLIAIAELANLFSQNLNLLIQHTSLCTVIEGEIRFVAGHLRIQGFYCSHMICTFSTSFRFRSMLQVKRRNLVLQLFYFFCS